MNSAACVPAPHDCHSAAPVRSAGKRSFFRLLVPYGLVDRATAQQIASLSYEPALEQTRRFWESVETQAGAITTPDAFLNDYLAAVAGNMAEQVAYRHKAGVSPTWPSGEPI